MKRILIFVISIVFTVNLTAQVGIDLTEMVNAPDSGYIIITTGDEYPERGLQKYVPFDSLIPLDTIFRSGDSVCLQFAYQSAPVCFPDSASQNLALVRDGDTIRISISGGNEVAFRDSTRSNQDITTVIRDSIPTVDSVWHKGDSIVIRMTDGHRWAVIDKIGGELDTVYFDGGDLCIQYTDLSGPTLICTPVDIPGDDWGNQVVEIAGDNISGDGTAGNKLTVNKQDLQSVTDKGNTTTNKIEFPTQIGTNKINAGSLFRPSSSDPGLFVITLDDESYVRRGFSMIVQLSSIRNPPRTGLQYIISGDTWTNDQPKNNWRQGLSVGVWGTSQNPVPRVRFANDVDSNKVILIGDATTNFGWTLLSVKMLDDLLNNDASVSISFSSTDDDYTNISEPAMNENISVDMVDGYHADDLIQEIFKLGDTIRLSETGYYVIDDRLSSVYRDGDSIRFETLEGHEFAVRDSFLSKQDIINEITPGMIDTIIHIGDSIQVELNSGDSYTVRDSFLTAAEVTQIARDSLPHVDTFHRSGDSLYLTLTDGTILPVRDSFLTIEEISQVVGDSAITIYTGDGTISEPRTVTVDTDKGSVEFRRPLQGNHYSYISIDSTGAMKFLNDHNGQMTGIDVSGGTEILKVHTGENIGSLTESDNYFLKLVNGNGQVEYRKVTTLDGVTHVGDSIQFDFDDGSTLMVRDSVLTKLDVATIARDSVEIPDMVNIYNSDGALTSTRTVDLNGKALIFSGTGGVSQYGAVVQDGSITSQQAVSTFFNILQYEDGYDQYGMLLNPLLGSALIWQNTSTGEASGSIANSNGFSVFTNEYPFGAYPDSTSNYFLKLMDANGAVKYRPVVQVDTFRRLGDSLYLDLDDGSTLAVRDSFMTPGDVMTVIGDSLEIVTVQDFYRDGDSVRLELSDGTKWAVLDSFVDLAGIRDTLGIHRDSIISYDQRLLTLNDSIAAHRQDIDGNTTLIQDHIDNDLDLDPTNELQTISRTGTDVTLSDGGGTVSIEDDDPDPTNEIQGFGNYSNPSGESGLVKLENNASGVGLKLSGTGGVDVDASFDGNDVVMTIDASSIDGNTNLSHTKVGNNVTINSSTGSGTTFSVADGDSDNTNELQDLTRTGDIIGLSNSVATTLDRNVTAITHTGDSVKFTTSDGREFVVRDSVLSKDTVLSWVDDTSIYTHDGTIQDGLRTVSIPDTAKLRFDMESGAQFELNSGEKGRMIYRTGALPIYPFFGLYNYNDATEDSTSFVANPFAIALQAWSGEDNHHRIELSKSLQAISITTTARDTDLDLKRYFIHSSSQGGGGIAFDSLRLTDIGISAADTARWGQGGLSGLNPDEVVYGGQDGQAAQTANFNYKDGALQVGTTSKTGHRLSMHAAPTLATGQDTSIIHISGNSAGSNQGQTVNGLRMDWTGNTSNSVFKGMTLNYINTSGSANYGVLMEGNMKLGGGFVDPRSLILNTEMTNGLHANKTFYGITNSTQVLTAPTSSSHGTTYTGFRNEFTADDILVPNTAGSDANVIGYHSIINFNEVDNKVIGQALRVTFGGAAASSMNNLYGIFQNQNFVKNYFNGSVGIATTAPTQKLDVNGDVRFRWHLYDAYNNNGAGFANAVLSRDAGGIRWRSETNYYQSFTSFTNPTSTSGLARLSNTSSGGLRLEGSGGIDVDASFNGTDVVMSIDGSSITGDAYTLVKTTEPAIEFRKNGTPISNIAFVGTGGIQVNDGFGQIEIDGSGISGGATNLGSSKTGTNVTVTSSTGTNTTFSVADNDNSSTNEIQGFGSYSNPTSTSGLVKLENNASGIGLNLTGTGGIDVDASFNGTDVVMTIDGSGISGSSGPWVGVYPNAYLPASNASVGIGSAPNTSALYINNSSSINESIDIDHNVGDNSSIMSVQNTRRNGVWQLVGGADGVSMRLLNTSGSQSFRVFGNGNIVTTGSITAGGSIGTSGQVLYGGSSPSWGDPPTGTTNLGSSKSGTNVTVTSSTGTNTTFSVADNDNSSTNEIQDLGLSGNTLTISGGGSNVSLAPIASKWSSSGSNIYRNSGVSIGSSAVTDNKFDIFQHTRVRNGTQLSFQGPSGSVDAHISKTSSSSFEIDAGSNDLRLIGGNVVYKTGSNFASNTVVVVTGNMTLPSASGYPNGTEKILIYTGSTFARITYNGSTQYDINPDEGVRFVAYGSKWYGMH